jgi:hypothetical protein
MVKIPRAAPATARSTDRRASLPPNYVADHRAVYVSEVLDLFLDVVAVRTRVFSHLMQLPNPEA